MIPLIHIDSFTEVWQEINLLYRQTDNPLRYPTVLSKSTAYPQGRTMVLRDVFPTSLVFFTDRRSPKWVQFIENPNMSVHCYIPSIKVQFLFRGLAKLDPPLKQQPIYRQRGLRRWQDYGTKEPPSSIAPSSVVPIEKQLVEDNFAILLCEVLEIEILQLGTPNHRVLWLKKSNDWQRHFLVP